MSKRKSNISFKLILFLVAPFLAAYIMLFENLDPQNPQTTYMFGLTVWIALWWVSEIIPLGITSLLPVVLFPLFGVMDGKEVASVYFNDVIFLFMGGFIVALAIQKWNLHKRIALWILKFVGLSPARIMLGFMLSTTFLSMWISNTATTMMMVPILISILSKLEEINGAERVANYSVGVLLAVGYSATVGGIATLVGTPPNLSFVRIFHIYFPNAPEISFGDWFVFAFPICIVLFLVFFVYLYFIYVHKKTNWESLSKSQVEKEISSLGKPKSEEKIIFVLFILMALLWFTRSDIVISNFTFHGWSDLLPFGKNLNDGTIAIFIAVILFMIPSKTVKDDFIMTWNDAQKLPWEIILLFGGGFALASGMKASGLADWCGQQLVFFEAVHPFVIILVITLLITFLGEFSSNTAVVETFLPVLAGLALTLNINPLFFMIPATLGASMGFMMPIATPPNAIVFATKRIKMSQMMRAGFVLNILSVVVISLFMYFLGAIVFGIDLSQMPDWVNH